MASEYYSVMLEALNITCHQLTLPTTMVAPVPIRPVNKTRPFSRGALILKAITPLRENRVWPRETRITVLTNFSVERDNLFRFPSPVADVTDTYVIHVQLDQSPL